MKRWIKYIPVMVLMLSITGCGKKEQDIPELLEPVGVQVDVAQVQRADVTDFTIYTGQIVPYVESLYFTEDGYLENMNVAVGDYVEKGQVLATINEEELTEQIEKLEEEIADIVKLGELSDQQAGADIKAAKLELELMREAGERVNWQSGSSLIDYNIKYVEMEAKELSLKQTQELRELELQEKKKQLSVLKKQKGNNKITAPFDGQVVFVSDFDLEGKVREYDPVICLADESRLSMVADFISEADITRAERVYAQIKDKEYEIVYLPYTTGEYLEMVLSGEEIKTRFSVDADEGELASGQYAVVVVIASSQKNVLTVPGNALYKSGNGQYVYKIEDGEKVKCPVTVGVSNDVRAEITEGLEEGDMVYVKE